MAYRRGIVQQIGAGQWNGYVRVRWPDRDNALSWWLPVSTRGTQGTKEWWIPEVGAQVSCDLDQHDEDGCVIGEVWSSVDAPVEGATPTQRRTDYSDGSSIVYDTATHEFNLSIVNGGTGTIAVAGHEAMIFQGNGTIQITGALRVSGDIAWNTGTTATHASTHTHTQGPDSHGDTEAPTSAPTAGS